MENRKERYVGPNDLDLKTLFEVSGKQMMNDESVASDNVTIDRNQEDISKHFVISESIGNKYKTQVRIT